MTEPTMIPADKAYRNKMLAIFAIVLLLAFAVSQWGIPALMRQFETAVNNGDEALLGRTIRAIEIVFVVLFLGFIPFCVYNVRMGLLARSEQRFPCSKMRVLRDTRLLTGEQAVKRGNLLVGLGATLIVISILTAVFAVLTIETLSGGML